tara:strand:- start:9 stop:152 length:144 start_codon:yes stop_codon:yes gene_type:complete
MMRNKSHQPPFNEVVQFVLDASDVFLADREGILVVLFDISALETDTG